ncbi:hypothetical protein BF32_112 [Bacillus thuringiensis]|uniref:hypothetical protein n=1 Tax=Bacillus thuringiensis TaxID=1428 RepID=UPI0000E89E27|nr:hypothetical protein [Bacillus thuringiensis]HDR8036265.1 hypothetical protein [Bacillus cereus]ABK85515.1 conserved hypothetical protein [Bacillus thuringiensis str. Al Hakam]AJH69118.1 hypothetical protein BF32_112 [Bacillus thuringiensis]QKH28189.1 hypothetical protein FOC87_16710 [Bacillus thuringiensis]QKQ37859.1 hypothetical protein FOC85_24935 [Bacillus thuringiensis]
MLKSLNKKSLLREILVSGKELGGSLKDLPRIEPDGYITKYGKEIKELINLTLNLESMKELGIGKVGANIFTKRAILRIGMLLRDSEVAKEVRTQLLNIEENTATEIKTYEIDHETELHTKLVRAIANTSKESN